MLMPRYWSICGMMMVMTIRWERMTRVPPVCRGMLAPSTFPQANASVCVLFVFECDSVLFATAKKNRVRWIFVWKRDSNRVRAGHHRGVEHPSHAHAHQIVAFLFDDSIFCFARFDCLIFWVGGPFRMWMCGEWQLWHQPTQMKTIRRIQVLRSEWHCVFLFPFRASKITNLAIWNENDATIYWSGHRNELKNTIDLSSTSFWHFSSGLNFSIRVS